MRLSSRKTAERAVRAGLELIAGVNALKAGEPAEALDSLGDTLLIAGNDLAQVLGVHSLHFKPVSASLLALWS